MPECCACLDPELASETSSDGTRHSCFWFSHAWHSTTFRRVDGYFTERGASIALHASLLWRSCCPGQTDRYTVSAGSSLATQNWQSRQPSRSYGRSQRATASAENAYRQPSTSRCRPGEDPTQGRRRTRCIDGISPGGELTPRGRYSPRRGQCQACGPQAECGDAELFHADSVAKDHCWTRPPPGVRCLPVDNASELLDVIEVVDLT
jgi:hypothetical protein